MSDIYNKIRKDKLFFTFIAITEVSYLASILGIFIPSRSLYLFTIGFVAMITSFMLFYLLSYFENSITPRRKRIIMFFLFRLILTPFAFFLLDALGRLNKMGYYQ
jgi:dolichyl-phosphate-mannose--protein O-mannosyl transferase